jgi:hypothetical protein
VQRHPEPIASFQHQAVKPCGIDPGLGIAGADLTGGDIRRGIDREVCRDRQFGEIYVLAFDDPLLPGRAFDKFDRAVILAALSEGRGEGGGVYAHCGGDQASIAGEIGDDRHIETLDVFEYVSWNSEAGRVSGTIIAIHTTDFDYKGHVHHASEDDPQYEIKSDKTDHIAAHKGSALERTSK